MKLENEKALIRTIAEGNTKSFEVLFYSYYPRLKGFICDLLQSPEEADIERNMLFKNYQQKQTESTPNVIEDNDIYKYIDAKELELLITIAVERMPPQRQRIYKMSREQGMSNDEIAASLCINKRTVENHLTQALADIRKLLSLILIIFF